MGINGIFALFGFSGEDEEPKENIKIKKEFDDYKKTPHFKMGMFLKLIMNGNIFKKQIISFFSKSDPLLDVNGIDDAGEFMMFSRASFWIEEFKFNSKIWKGDLKKHSDTEFLTAIKLSIHYFESTEEYEKCAHLKKIQTLIEKNIQEIQKSVAP